MLYLNDLKKKDRLKRQPNYIIIKFFIAAIILYLLHDKHHLLHDDPC